MSQSPYARKFTVMGIVLALVIIVSAMFAGRWFFQQSEKNPMSEEAVIKAHVVNIAATVGGKVITLAVRDNQRVNKGDLLFALDPEPYQLAVEQTKADLSIAKAELAAQGRAISAEQSNAVIANEQVNRARNNLKLAESTLARLLPLESKGYVTSQQVDTARTAKRDAQTSLEQALRQADAASALVTTLDATQALVKARQAALAIAERALAQTQVYAPHDGLVVGLHVSSGEIIAPGQALFTLIDTSHWYAVATFPETELGHIAAGDCARVYVLSNRAKPIQGKVESIGWGVISEDMINLPRGLPYVPKSLNWVRIEQRFPVQIELTNPPPELMRMGASAVTIVHQGERCGDN